MRYVIYLSLSVLMSCVFIGCKPQVGLESDITKFSYSYGAIIGKDLRTQNVEIDLNALKAGIEDAYNNSDMLMQAEEIDHAYLLFQQTRYNQLKLKEEQVIKLNIEEGNKFLEKNRLKKGVVTYENGLQYKVIKKGTGKKPSLDSVVSIHFIDKFVDGTLFYNTYEKVNPVQFKIGDSPQGWSLVLPLMREGAIWELYLPGNLAYAEKPVPNQGPYKAIISKIELIEIVDDSKLK